LVDSSAVALPTNSDLVIRGVGSNPGQENKPFEAVGWTGAQCALSNLQPFDRIGEILLGCNGVTQVARYSFLPHFVQVKFSTNFFVISETS